MTRKTLAFALFALLAITAHAQRFDWVRTYTGPEFSNGYAANEIYGSVMDIGGNVYILGHFIGGANWDDNSDIIPLSSVHRNRSAVVAKFSPDGEMVWHKEFYSSYTDFNVFTIRMVGDTALMLYAEFRFPFNSGTSKNEVYYLDTLLTNSERFPESPDTLKSPNLHYAYITIGTESGNLIEEHFLIPSYVKNDGSLLRDKYTGYLTTYFGKRTAVNVDSEGNIILVLETADIYPEPCDTCPDGYYYWSPTYGNISTMRLLIDGATKQLDVPLEPSSTWNRHIIKLSPHLDSVIASTYVFDSTWRYHYNENISMYLNSIDVDESDNIYVLLRRKQDPVDRWPVKNSDTLAMEWYQCMIRYNSSLTPTGITQVTSSYTPEGYYCGGGLEFLNTCYDTTTNSLFLQGFSGRNQQYHPSLNLNGDTLNLKNNACWLRLDADDLSLISYGKARSTDRESYERTYLYTDKHLLSHNGSFVAGNNRVFCQVKYQCNILFNDTQINSPYGMGLFVWDYDGHELEYIDYNSPSSTNEQGYIFLKDSSLWLSGTLTANADFGDFHINAAYNSHAYLAHYTDTSFMTPYVYKDTTGNGGDTNDVRIILPEEGNALVAYPNPFRQRINVEYSGRQPITAAYLTDIMGRTEQVELSATAPGRYTLDLTARPQAAYLLTLVTQDGHRHTVKLLKQSDIFGR